MPDILKRFVEVDAAEIAVLISHISPTLADRASNTGNPAGHLSATAWKFFRRGEDGCAATLSSHRAMVGTCKLPHIRAETHVVTIALRSTRPLAWPPRRNN
jgi:hypothetical protein